MLNLNDFFKECKENPVSLSLQTTKKLGNGSYRILCSCTHTKPSNLQIKKAVKKLFGTKASVIEETVRVKDNNLVSMVVKANVRSKAYNPNSLPEGMKQVTANIVTDVNEGTIWEVVSENGSKRLVLNDEQDFDKVFEHNNRICTAALNEAKIQLGNGDYVSFFDTKTLTVKAGYLVIAEDDSLFVIDRELNEHPVVEEQILEATDLTDIDRNPIVLLETMEVQPEEVDASLSKNDAKTILDYLKILFKDTEFYNKLDELVGAQSGKEGLTTTMIEAGLLDGDFEDIKSKIKDFLIHKSVEELEDEILNENSSTEPIDDEPANSEGDIDFATEEEIIESDVNNADERLQIQKEDAFQMTGSKDEEIGEISVDLKEEDFPAEDILTEDQIEVTTEAELDEGEFEDVEIKDMSDEELINSLKEALNV